MKREEMLMHPDEYRVMFEIEDDYWWYRGLRAMLHALMAQYRRGLLIEILDIGCGSAKNLQLLKGYGHAVGIDLSERAIRNAHQRGLTGNDAFLASALELPFRAERFDLAISFDVICNIADDGAAFAEVARVLKPGGRLITLLPANEWLWSAHDIAVSHQRRYSPRRLREQLTRAGFAIERLTYLNALFFPLILAARLAQNARGENHPNAASDLKVLPRPLNALFTALYSAETRLATRVSLPFGVSLLALARKKATS